MTISSLPKFLFILLLLGAVSAMLPAPANGQDRKDTTPHAERADDDDEEEKLNDEDKQRVKLSLEDARAIATGRINGKVIDEELEKERGRVQYAFDIRDEQGKVWDVEIDANTGEVLQAVEDDDDDNDVSSAKRKKLETKKNSKQTAKVIKTKP